MLPSLGFCCYYACFYQVACDSKVTSSHVVGEGVVELVVDVVELLSYLLCL